MTLSTADQTSQETNQLQKNSTYVIQYLIFGAA